MKKYVIAGVMALSLIVPASVFAETTADIDPLGTASDCVVLTSDLRYRARDINTNGDVSTLQDFLSVKGYLNSEPTGYFGVGTLAAVKKYQSANGITPTGFVGALTRAKIKAQTCGGAPVNPGPVATPGCPAGAVYSYLTGKPCSGQPSAAPSCSLTADKAYYTLGETITYTWTGKNASYAYWQQDTSGKDTLSLPGDKLPLSGSQQIKATVIGNPKVMLHVIGDKGYAGCSVTVNISGGIVAAPSLTVTSQNSPTTWTPNSYQTITWNTTNIPSDARIQVFVSSYTGSYVTEFNPPLPNTGSAVINVLSNIPAGQYVLTLKATVNGVTVSDKADSIITMASTAEPMISVLLPNYNAVWAPNSIQSLTWSTLNVPSDALVRVFLSNSTYSSEFVPAVYNTGFTNISVLSNIPAGQYRLKLQTTVNGRVIEDEANGDVTVLGY
jgi:uncharacterized repeat protein (TIGR01451 family)